MAKKWSYPICWHLVFNSVCSIIIGFNDFRWDQSYSGIHGPSKPNSQWIFQSTKSWNVPVGLWRPDPNNVTPIFIISQLWKESKLILTSMRRSRWFKTVKIITDEFTKNNLSRILNLFKSATKFDQYRVMDTSKQSTEYWFVEPIPFRFSTSLIVTRTTTTRRSTLTWAINFPCLKLVCVHQVVCEVVCMWSICFPTFISVIWKS